MCRGKTTINPRLHKFKINHHWLFKPKYQKLHLEILGSLIFWVGLPLSKPAWSVPSVEAATISVSKIDQKESTAVTAASQDDEGDGRYEREGGYQREISALPSSPSSASLPFPASPLFLSPNLEDPELGNLRLRKLEGLPTPSDEPSQIENRSDADQLTNSQDPELGNLRLRKLEGLPTPSDEPSQIKNRSDADQLTNGEDPELGNLRLRKLEGSPTPSDEPSQIGNRSESEQPGDREDPDLGNLRLRELERPPAVSKSSVYLLGGVGYLRSNNVFADVNPVDDGLVRAGLTLLANPSLGPETSLFVSVGGNLIRYDTQSQFDYNELRFNAGIRQELSPRAYGEVGWNNRQLFDKESGDRFLNDHSLYLELGRRDTLAKQLTLDTYYQFRLSLADPTNRSQAINSVGATLAYNPSSSLQLALDYQFALANFTEQERQDQYHQLIARLTYTLSSNSRLYLFGGHSFGNSSDPNIDFNGFIFGGGVDFNFTLF
ncbi:MAG TPA: hypothetical protein DCE56_44275 [Cyanobacteria bacterium UBA8553]|nr:hypothetical protein [Cyanobacteria bacterium UBA8553]